MKQWLENLTGLGLVPYVATSEGYLSHLDVSLFGGREIIRVVENPDHKNFHEAYLLSNSLGFGNPDLKMPNWVYIDCVLMQSAVVGFAVPRANAPKTLLDFYAKDAKINVDALDYIPVSGQIAGLGIDGQTLIGFSLFSLRKLLNNPAIPNLGIPTKLAAMHVYGAENKERFLGIAQYNNPAILTHARFGKHIYIDRPMMPLHPLGHMTFVYGMKIDLDEGRIFGDDNAAANHDFLLRSDDEAKKAELQKRIQDGETFEILPPVHIQKDGGLYLPIKEGRRT